MEFMLAGRINPALVKLVPTIPVSLYFTTGWQIFFKLCVLFRSATVPNNIKKGEPERPK